MSSPRIAWLRNDLRLADNPALDAALKGGDRVIALYVHEEVDGVRPPGAAARWWLHRSLTALENDLAQSGVELMVRTGAPGPIIGEIVDREGVEGVFWNRRYAPGERAVDAAIKSELVGRGVTVQSFAANALIEPWEIVAGQGKPY